MSMQIDLGDDAYLMWVEAEVRRQPSEKRLVEILSEAMRTDEMHEKAQYFVDLANMAMAMADKTLGSQSLVATSIELRSH